MRPVIPLLLLLLAMTGCGDPAVGVGPAATPNATSSASGAEDAGGPVEQGIAVGEPAPTGALPSGPIPVEPDGGIGDGASPPADPGTAAAFGVSSETDSAAVDPFTYCWTDSSGAGLCADGFPTSRAELSADAQLVVTYPEGTLTAMSSDRLPGEGPGVEQPERTPLPVQQENPGIWLVDISGLPAGQHAVWLTWNGEQGDSHTVLTVSIDR